MFRSVSLSAAALLLSQATIEVQAHGELIKPFATYPKWGGAVTATIAPSVMPFPWRQDYPQAFAEAFKKTGLSLKDFILKNQNMSGATENWSTPDCGYSNPNGKPQPLPPYIEYTPPFIHWGPCEAYCDDVLVAPYTVDCRATFKNGQVPYDKAKCVGKKRFTFYWLGMDGSPWQVYNNCVPLAQSGSGDSAGDDAATPAKPTTGKTPAATTKPATTKKPATNAKPATTKKPTAPITSAPSPTKKKCKRRN
ncbi:hypothetical protein PybrP1_000106 [[Pythium] brassicae (nom. inval.)]|nr:hypothetical protein PybrP1_000106 [[Pythium] brassicae (nom. inval.)]